MPVGVCTAAGMGPRPLPGVTAGRGSKFREGDAPRAPGGELHTKTIALIASQVKKANVEALPKWEEEELLAEFMEEFNTATLPHKKYYNLEVYERERAMKAAKRGAGTGVSWRLPAGLHGCQAVGGQRAGVGVLITCPHSGCRCPHKPARESVQATCECGQAGCGHRGDHGLSALMTATAGVQAQGSARLTPSWSRQQGPGWVVANVSPSVSAVHWWYQPDLSCAATRLCCGRMSILLPQLCFAGAQ